MASLPRHQCLIYEGSPSKHLAALAAVLRTKLKQKYRCIYLDSRPMIAGLRSYLAAQGVDVLEEIASGNLVFSSEQAHLSEGKFDLDRMMRMLREALDQARRDGYAGLWASGDMTWEFGPQKDFSQLLEYEHRLEEFIQQNPDFCGICQYHGGTLPREILRQALVSHPTIFFDQAASELNPYFLSAEPAARQAANDPRIESALHQLLQRNQA